MEPKATDTLIPQLTTVVVGEGEDQREIKMATFCLAKSLLAVELIADLVKQSGLGDEEEPPADGDYSISPLLRKFTRVWASGMSKAQPAFYRLVGLAITSNKRLATLENNEEDIHLEILKVGKELAYTITNDQLINLLKATVECLGVESIFSQFTKLAALLKTIAKN